MINMTPTVPKTASFVLIFSSQAFLFTFITDFCKQRSIMLMQLSICQRYLEHLGVRVKFVRLCLEILELTLPLHDPVHVAPHDVRHLVHLEPRHVQPCLRHLLFSVYSGFWRLLLKLLSLEQC